MDERLDDCDTCQRAEQSRTQLCSECGMPMFSPEHFASTTCSLMVYGRHLGETAPPLDPEGVRNVVRLIDRVEAEHVQHHEDLRLG